MEVYLQDAENLGAEEIRMWKGWSLQETKWGLGKKSFFPIIIQTF